MHQVPPSLSLSPSTPLTPSPPSYCHRGTPHPSPSLTFQPQSAPLPEPLFLPPPSSLSLSAPHRTPNSLQTELWARETWCTQPLQPSAAPCGCYCSCRLHYRGRGDSCQSRSKLLLLQLPLPLRIQPPAGSEVKFNLFSTGGCRGELGSVLQWRCTRE